MPIDWSSEPFSRLYKRETDDDLLLSWEARAVWHEFLKRCDASGFIATKRGAMGLAALIRIPLDVVERVLPELLDDGRLQEKPSVGFWAPNYVEANYVARTTAARKMASRLGQRARCQSGRNDSDGIGSEDSEDVTTSHVESRDVTSSHVESRDVTSSHVESQNRQSDHTNHTNHTNHHSASDDAGASKKRRAGIPEDWEPRDAERKIARELGLDCDREAEEFKTYWLGDGRPKKNWDLTFRNRLYSLAKRAPLRQGLFQTTQSTQGIRRIKEVK